ncbi:unnamed protein product, partial [Brachionus calyciflorus]
MESRNSTYFGFTHYRKAKINFSREPSTINKKVYKKAKNAFRKQQQNNIDLIKIKQFVKLNKKFKSNMKIFHGMVKKMITEVIQTTKDIEDAKIEIPKHFNEIEIPNIALEEENKKKLTSFLRKIRMNVFTMFEKLNNVEYDSNLKPFKFVVYTKSKGDNFRHTQKYNANGCLVYIGVSFKEKGKLTNSYVVTKMDIVKNQEISKQFYQLYHTNRKIREEYAELSKAMLQTGSKPSKVALHVSKLCNKSLLTKDLHNIAVSKSSSNEDESSKLQDVINVKISHDGGINFFTLFKTKMNMDSYEPISVMKIILDYFKVLNDSHHLKTVMIDKDLKEESVIKETFPNVQILYCQQFNDFGCHSFITIRESIDKKVTNRIENNLMDNSLCAKICSLYGHEYSATYKEYFCFCLNNDLKIDTSLNSNKCNMPCENKNENCGGSTFYPNTFTVNFNQFKSTVLKKRSLEDDNQLGIVNFLPYLTKPKILVQDAIIQTNNESLRLSYLEHIPSESDNSNIIENSKSTVQSSSTIRKLEKESTSTNNAKFGKTLLSIFQYSTDSNGFSNKNNEYGTSSEFSFSTPKREIFEHLAASVDKYPKIVGCVDRMQGEKFQKEKYFKDLTNAKCSDFCKSENFNYSETNIGNTKSNCFCVDATNIKEEKSNKCNLECKEGSGEMCGGDSFKTVSLTQIKYDANNPSDLYKASFNWFGCLNDYTYFAVLENVKDEKECAKFCEFLVSTNYALNNNDWSKDCFCGKREIQNFFFVQFIPICILSQYSVFTIEPFWLSFECGGNLT